MDSKKFASIILAGGFGTRLWPLSRTEYPKQFLPIFGEKSLLQQTVLRTSSKTSSPPILMCAENHRFLVAEQLKQIGVDKSSILLEPASRNTAPSITAAALHVLNNEDDRVVVVMPADHLIPDINKFNDTIDTCVTLANTGLIVTIGIEPNRPETGYGYIKSGDKIAGQAANAFSVSQFIEKPSKDKAEKLIKEGRCSWNAGIFVFKPSVFLKAVEQFNPDIHRHCRAAVDNAQSDLDFIRLDSEYYSQCENISVDYAVMEKASNVAVVPFGAQWSDIGSWDAVHRASELDDNGNASVGDVVQCKSSDTYVHASSRMVVTSGVKNLSIIETPDAVLVLDNENAQSVKDVVNEISQTNPDLLSNHTTVYRPWGHYESLKMSSRFQVKRITVKPGAKLSLQKHHHRSEHWVVVSGTAVVTVGEEEKLLTENESVYIPLGAYHRLHNPGTIPLQLIEVQSGAYLGEDDIVRVGDEYGRA